MNDLADRLDRYRRFYAGSEPERLLVVISYAGGEPGLPIDLSAYDFSDMGEHRRLWDTMIHNLVIAIRNHDGILDDWIPGVEVGYGYGAFGAVFGDGTLRFTDRTSFIDPALPDWDDPGAFDLNTQRFWADAFVEAADTISRRADGRFLVNAFPAPTPLDIANLLRGNEVFLDFYLAPGHLKRFLDAATEALIAYVGRIAEATHNPLGGRVAFGRWVPHGTVIVEDAGDLCSPEIYREFAAPYTQRVIDAIGGAYLHHHSLGRHQYANIAALRGLYVQQISSDPNCRRPITELSYLLEQVGDMPVDLECTAEEVYEYGPNLAGARAILSVDMADKREACALVEYVRRLTA